MHSGTPRPLRSAVVVMAFSQMLLFLALWLWICAAAGGAPPGAAAFEPKLLSSSYTPVKTRDPFRSAGSATVDVNPAAAGPAAFRLEGILYERHDPAAIVNGQLLRLNKTVTVSTGHGEIPVRALQITRERVLLEAAGQRVELRIAAADAAAGPAE
jgi:hypothetical protein